MNTNPYMKYQQATVQTSGPQLLLMLYDGAIKFVRFGIEGIQQNKLEQANTNLIKAQKIIHELIAALNFEYVISQNLVLIYEYMIGQLIKANMRKSVAPAQEVLGYLNEMKEAWAQAAKSPAPLLGSAHQG